MLSVFGLEVNCILSVSGLDVNFTMSYFSWMVTEYILCLFCVLTVCILYVLANLTCTPYLSGVDNNCL